MLLCSLSKQDSVLLSADLQRLNERLDTALGMQEYKLHLLMSTCYLCRYSAALGDIVIGRVTEVSTQVTVLIALQLHLKEWTSLCG